MKHFSFLGDEISAVFSARKRIFWTVAIFSAVINILMLVPSIYMLQVYDRVLSSGNVMTLWMLTAITISLFIIMGALDYIRSMIAIRLSNYFDMQLNERVYTAAYQAALNQGANNAGQMLNDLMTIRQFFTGSTLFSFFDIFWFPIYLFVIFLFNVWLGILALSGAIILLLLAILNERLTKTALRKASQFSTQSNQLASTNLRNIDVITAMGMLPQLRQRWLTLHLQFLNFQSQASEYASAIMAMTKTVRLLLQSLVLGMGAFLVIHHQMTPGMMIAGSILMGRTLAPIEQIITAWKGFNSTRFSWQRLRVLLEENPKPIKRITLPVPQGVLTVEKIVASIPTKPEQSIIKNIQFTLQGGNVLGIIGASASGKSTLARVLAGIWPVQTGNIRLDGADIYQWDKEELGPYIGYLPQDIELFSGTIAENIARFNELDSAKIITAAQKAGVHEMILALEKGYDTLIGHDGVGLSGGQRQRIGLARALYNDPVFIILDEPNSNLDDAGEMALNKTIAALKEQHKTVILITHRTSLLSQTTHLLFLVQGEMRAFGPTEKVMEALAKTRVNHSNKPLIVA